MNPVHPPPQTREASIGAALDALRSNRPLRAEEICRSYLETSPGCVEHLRMLGTALGKQGRYPESEQTVRLAIALQPSNPHLHEDLGSVLALQERFEEAVPCFEQAIRLEPRLPLAHKKLGQALAALGRGQDADAAFEEFFEQDSARGQVALALDHLRAGRKTEAIDTLRSALRENASNVDAMRFLAHIYWQEEQQHSDAEALLRRATTLAPAYPAPWVMLGTMLHD
jgi:tetratricopeptide (TPR) repeat protein